LGQQPAAELAGAPAAAILAWAVAHWDAGRIPRTRSLAEAQLR
ncbi:MAG: tRNA glutamyl-Q(34) synthetase GluQRS, partial [Pseudomonadaceae bacterium]